MRWRAAVLRGAFVAGLALPTSCAAGRGDADLKPPPGFVPPPVWPLQKQPIFGRPRPGRGFWPMEMAANKTWRWMADRGEVRLPNRHVRQRLRIFGWVPLELLAGPPTIQITLQDHQLDRFVASERNLNRQFFVKREQLGDRPFAVLLIETSATAHAPGDTRRLGISIEGIEWEDAP